jgi:hypothetical protein
MVIYGLDRAFSTAGAEDSKTMAVDICQSVGGLLINWLASFQYSRGPRPVDRGFLRSM